MNKVRIEIRCGSISEFRNAPKCAANPIIEIIAFYDKILNRAYKMSDINHAKYVTDYMEILDDNSIDVISDCSTNETHHIISGRALELKNTFFAKNR